MTNAEPQPRFIVRSIYRPELARDMFYVVDTEHSVAVSYEVADVDNAADLAISLNQAHYPCGQCGATVSDELIDSGMHHCTGYDQV